MLSGRAKYLSTLPAPPKGLVGNIGSVCGTELLQFTSSEKSNSNGQQKPSTTKLSLDSRETPIATVEDGENIKCFYSKSTGAGFEVFDTASQSTKSLGGNSGEHIEVLANAHHLAVVDADSGVISFLSHSSSSSSSGAPAWKSADATAVTGSISATKSGGRASTASKKNLGSLVAAELSACISSDTSASHLVTVWALEAGGAVVTHHTIDSTDKLVSKVVRSAIKGEDATSSSPSSLFSTSGPVSGSGVQVQSMTVSNRGEAAIVWTEGAASFWNISTVVKGKDVAARTVVLRNLVQASSTTEGDDVVESYIAQEDILAVQLFASATSSAASRLLVLIKKTVDYEVQLTEFFFEDLLLSASTSDEDLLLKRQAGAVTFNTNGPEGTGKIRTHLSAKISSSAAATGRVLVSVQRQLYEVLPNIEAAAIAAGGSDKKGSGLSAMEIALRNLGQMMSAAPSSTPATGVIVQGGINSSKLASALLAGGEKGLQEYLLSLKVAVLRDSLFLSTTNVQQPHFLVSELRALVKKANNIDKLATITSCLSTYASAATGISLISKVQLIAAVVATALEQNPKVIQTPSSAQAAVVDCVAEVVIAASSTSEISESSRSSSQQVGEVAKFLKITAKTPVSAPIGTIDVTLAANVLQLLYPLVLHALEYCPTVGTVVEDIVQIVDAIFLAHGGASSSLWSLLPADLPRQFQHLFQVVGHWAMSEPGTYIGQLSVNCGPQSTAKKEPSIVENIAYRVNTAHSTRITREVLTLPTSTSGQSKNKKNQK